MYKRLLIMIALVSSCFVSVAYAEENNLSKWNISHLIEAQKLYISSQDQSLIIENSAIGPHGRYLMISGRCVNCHESDGEGERTLLESNITRDDSCNWCHGAGAASSRYVSMDNDDEEMREYDTGHSHGFGISSGKWSAPDDTYPAYTPRFWLGGLSCFDCHSVHAIPEQTLGYGADGTPSNGVLDPGFTSVKTASKLGKPPIYEAGHWVLKKNPDQEFDTGYGAEIDDEYSGEFSSLVPYPVNKIEINWDDPQTPNPFETLGASTLNVSTFEASSADISSPSSYSHVSTVHELCIDCHDGNGGTHDVTSLVFTEELAANGESGVDSYTEANGHDSQQGECTGQAEFNPEDGDNNGPDCRSCHRGAGDCDLCHAPGQGSDINWPREAYTPDPAITEARLQGVDLGNTFYSGDYVLDNSELEHTINMDPSFESAEVTCSPDCMNLGLTWPHRTLAWKMLKNELFGIDLDGSEVGVGERREILAEYLSIEQPPAHDIDSVCLDCHNPTQWQPGAKAAFMRGLP